MEQQRTPSMKEIQQALVLEETATPQCRILDHIEAGTNGSHSNAGFKPFDARGGGVDSEFDTASHQHGEVAEAAERKTPLLHDR